MNTTLLLQSAVDFIAAQENSDSEKSEILDIAATAILNSGAPTPHLCAHQRAASAGTAARTGANTQSPALLEGSSC